MKKSSYLMAGAIAAAVGVWLLTGILGDEAQPPPVGVADREDASDVPAVQVVDLTAQPHVRRLTLFGRTEADRTVEVKSETAGRVAAKVARKGQTVKAGDVLVRLDMEDREARLREAEALVEQWEAMAEASKSLARSGYAARLKSAEDRAALEAARAQLEEIRLDIARTTIRAPFAGVVDDIVVDEGDYLDRYDMVATVVDLDPITIAAEVTEGNAGQVTVGGEANVRLVTGETVTGTLIYVARTARPGTRTFKVEVEAPNPDLSVLDGITAEVELPLDDVAAHRVSPAILTLDDEGRVGVKLVDDQDRVVFHPVTVVDDTPEGIWITGLPTQARVITVGQEFVRQGQQVRPTAELVPSGDKDLAAGARGAG